MRVAATMLFIISFLAVVVLAVAVASHPTTKPMSFSTFDILTHCVGESNSAVGCISPGGAYHTAQSNLKLNSPYPGFPRAVAPIHSSKHPPELTVRDETETVVLVRRKSIAAKIRAAFHHLGHNIKHAFQKVGHAIKHAAQKVGHFLKTTGAKIAKVGLKIAATVGKIAGKVVGFIPGVGKAVGKAMEGASEGLNKASDAIHAHIGGKLGKAMHRMDKAQKMVGYIP